MKKHLKILASLGLAIVLSSPSIGQTDEYDLPEINAENFPSLSGTNGLISVNYSVQAFPVSTIPFQPLQNGRLMKINVFVPPGCSAVSVAGTSNWWNAPGGDYELLTRMGVADFDMGNSYSHIDRPIGVIDDGVIYKSDLHVAGGGWNESIFGGTGVSRPVVTAPTTMYAYLHYPAGNTNNNGYFVFASFDISFMIMDVELYTEWRDAQNF